MGKRARKRMVYAATVVALLAMVSGFALASMVSTVASQNQNGYAVSAPGNTIYSGGSQTTDLSYTTVGTCTADGGTVAATAAATSANVYVDGIGGAGTCVSGSTDWYEEISFTSATFTGTSASDVFSITVGTNSPISVTVSFSGLTSGGSVITHIFYYVGTSGSPTTSDIGISGT